MRCADKATTVLASGRSAIAFAYDRAAWPTVPAPMQQRVLEGIDRIDDGRARLRSVCQVASLPLVVVLLELRSCDGPESSG
jgi:hypothetical protein